MKRGVAVEQAETFAALLPALMRQLMAGVNGPAVRLPLAQLRVCAILSDGPRSMSDLSRELAVSLSAMTQIGDRLERARLVKRVAAANDRRVRRLQLTDRGRRLIRLHEDARVQRVLAVFKRLPAKTRTEAVVTLQTLLGACRAAREQDGRPRKRNSHVTAMKVKG